MLADGMSSAEVALEKNIKAQTVSNHRKRIMKKSPYKNWCHFMAETGRSGQLDKWKMWVALHPRPLKVANQLTYEEQ